MTSEMYNKLMELITCITVMSSLSFVALFITCGLVFYYIYNKQTYINDLKRENQRKEDIINKLDKGYYVSSDYLQYLVAKAHKNNK